MPRPFHVLEYDQHPALRRTVTRLRVCLLAVVAVSGVLLLVALLAVRRAAMSAPRDGGSFAGVPLDGTLLALVSGFVAVGAALVLLARAPASLAREQAVALIDLNQRLHDSTLETFAALNATIEARDRFGAGHGLRVTLVSILIGQELGMSEEQLDAVRHAATFHDIGKVAVPDAVLQQVGRLDDAQFAAMKQHAVEGARICGKLQSLAGAVPIVRSHHERVDGRGYPDGLVGDAIPLGARIVAVADAWDALTSDRPYRQGQPAILALQEIRRCSGTQFDPVVVTAFTEVLAKDPWMFGLTPEEIAAHGSALPAPNPAPRGARGAAETARDRAAEARVGEIDWDAGFAADDLRASS